MSGGLMFNHKKLGNKNKQQDARAEEAQRFHNESMLELMKWQLENERMITIQFSYQPDGIKPVTVIKPIDDVAREEMTKIIEEMSNQA